MPAEPQPPPLVLALVLADNGHLDPTTNKFFILGTLADFWAPTFPFRLNSLAVYVAVTAGRGKTTFTIRLIDADETGEPLFSADHEVDFDTPLAVRDFVVLLEGLEIPEPGTYRLQLFADGAYLTERRFVASMS